MNAQPQGSGEVRSEVGVQHAPAGVADVLAIGFGTTVAMWAVGYVGHMPLTHIPQFAFVAVMLLCVIAGGWVAGRYTRRSVGGGVWVGLLSATLNLLILGSLLAKPHSGQLVPGVWLWLPGWFALSVVLAAIGAGAGQAGGAAPRDRDVNWVAGLGWITVLAALLLITAGGLVTGFRAGMAVPDWPNTFGSNMFLYPLAQMTGGVFYEHAHRLLGTLVGAAALALAIYVTWGGLPACPALRPQTAGRPDGPDASRGLTGWNRKPLIVLLWSVGGGVAVQGVFGGLRVTDDSHILAVIHGFFAHMILGGLVAAAVMLSRRWQGRCGAESRPAASTDRFFTVLVVAVVLLQTLLGTLVRQLDLSLLVHITVAAIVALIALAAGLRAWGLNPQAAVLRRSGVALMVLVLVQINLGIVALVFRTPPVSQSPTAEMLAAQAGRLPVTPLPALITTVHQATAAVILAVAVILAAWTWRLLATAATDVTKSGRAGP
jgi:cytochrome c oxidase assembly protein subunit 15